MISVIIPFYNEEDNLPVLVAQLKENLQKVNEGYEIIFIDDGSTDRSIEQLRPLVDGKTVQLVRHAKRLGKGRALDTGIKKSQGEIIVFMDADLQDDPRELPHFIQKIHTGYDLVNGVRQKRKDNPIIKFYSAVANRVLNTVLRSPFTDVNCGFKAFRRTILDDIVLYANNFRFLPLAAFYRGYNVTEIPVHHQARLHGVSKYGIGKIFIGLIDTLTAYFLYQFAEQPLHFFGVIGGLFLSIGFAIGSILTVERMFYGILLYRRPALQYAILFIIVGIQIVMTGILGELIVYLHKKKKT